MGYYHDHREEVWCYTLCIVLIAAALAAHRLFF